MAQLKEEEKKKMEAEYKEMAAEHEKLIAENKVLRTKNEELTKENVQMQKAEDERGQKCRSPSQKRQLSPAADSVVISTSTSTPNNANSQIAKKLWTPIPKKKRPLNEDNCHQQQQENGNATIKSRIIKMTWTPVAKKMRRQNEEICQQQQEENEKASTRISDKNVDVADLTTSSAKHAEAPIVADDELAPLEIVMDEEEEEVHPKINVMEPQQALSSKNGTTIIISTTMMTEVNEHHDSGFMENDTNKQQDDGDDAYAERVISSRLLPAPPSSSPPSPPPPPSPPLPVPSAPAAPDSNPLDVEFAEKFRQFLIQFSEVINDHKTFNLEATIDVFFRYNNMNRENCSPQEMETLKGFLRQIAILEIEAKKTKQIKVEAANFTNE